jgi:hypothetical protein
MFLVLKTKNDSIESKINSNPDIFIYIPLSIYCPYFLVKTSMSEKEFGKLFSGTESLYFNYKLIQNGIVKIEGWNEEIIEGINNNRFLSHKNQEDIDEIFNLLIEFDMDFLNFEQKMVLKNYSNEI